MPGNGSGAFAPGVEPILEAEHLTHRFRARGGFLRGGDHVPAVDDVTIDLREGETVGLVGESGCGKTTLARSLLRLVEPTGGAVRFRGRDITHASRRQLQPLREDVQIVFQDPVASLNPRRRVDQMLRGALRPRGLEGSSAELAVRELLERVGLSAEHLSRYPHELSGGQRQRIGIARALAPRPSALILDEPVSALDASIRAQILTLLQRLQETFGLAYLFVAHDLGVVRHISDRVAVMYRGKIVESGPAEELFRRPVHPYTGALIASVPTLERRSRRPPAAAPLRVGGSEPASLVEPAPACRFQPRCPRATDVCKVVEPPLTRYPDGRLAACHHPRNVSVREIGAAARSPASPRTAGSQLSPVS